MFSGKMKLEDILFLIISIFCISCDVQSCLTIFQCTGLQNTNIMMYNFFTLVVLLTFL